MSYHHPVPSREASVLSYMGLRKLVGAIAILLPILLLFGNWALSGHAWEDSISAYYYTDMRDVMVGCLCAIAVFLLSYKGYEPKDDITGNIACVFALGVAWFPAAPDGLYLTQADIVLGRLHSLCAGGFFLTLAYFSYFLFTKGRPGLTRQKIWRNLIYRICGVVIVLCAVGLGLVKYLSAHMPLQGYRLTFWLEASGIWAFGWSWFVKGEGILRDDEPAATTTTRRTRPWPRRFPSGFLGRT